MLRVQPQVLNIIPVNKYDKTYSITYIEQIYVHNLV